MLHNSLLYLPIEVINIIHSYYYRKDNYPFWYKATIMHYLQLANIHHEIMIWKQSYPTMKPKSLQKYPGVVMGGYKMFPNYYESPPLYVQTKVLQTKKYLYKQNNTSWIDLSLYNTLLNK
jgi:hypothetical protein